MSFQVRNLTQADLPKLKNWYETRLGWSEGSAPKWEDIPQETSYLCEREGDWLAVAFLYTSNSVMAWVEWTATNPQANPIGRIRALEHLMKHVKIEAHKRGARKLVQALVQDSLVEFYKNKMGFLGGERVTLVVSPTSGGV